jgi:6-phosphogluconate dehydrogenase
VSVGTQECRAFGKEIHDLTPTQILLNVQAKWRKVIGTAAELGIPVPAFSTALSFYDGYRSGRLPANLIQAQRDYFGAHTYELLADPGKHVHTNWTGQGGNVSSTTYDA